VWTAAIPGGDILDPDARGNDVFGRLVDRDGTPSGAPFVVIAANGHQSFPSVTANSTTGRYLVVWEDTRKNGFRDIEIAGR
jgi:hypothetical protein